MTDNERVMRNYVEPKTLPEMAIFVKLMFDDVHRQLTEVASKIDNLDVVSDRKHTEDMSRLREEIREIELNVENYRARQAALWKWLIGSLAIPAMAVIVAVIALVQT